MKKNYFLAFLGLFIGLTAFSQTPQRNFINYQGLARGTADELLVNTNLDLEITLRFGSNNAVAAYEEGHSLTTDANGVFSLRIGSGNRLFGDYETLPWGSEAAFISVTINGNPVGTTEIMAVPYAISSGDAQQTASEVPYSNTFSGLTAGNVQEAIDALVGSGTIDTDNQALVLMGDVLSIEGGAGSVDLSTYVDDADADLSNELQTLSFDITTNALSLTNGNTVILPSSTGDADPDPLNEIQDISLSGTEISITNGSTIDLAPLIPPGGSDDQNLELTGDILSIEGGTGSVDLSNYINDADADPMNEVDVTTQTGILLGDGTDVIGLVGTIEGQVPKWDVIAGAWVAGTDETGGVSGTSLWEVNGSTIFYDMGNVGVGTNNSGLIPGAAQYLTISPGFFPSDGDFGALELRGRQQTVNRPIGRIDFISEGLAGSAGSIARIETRTADGAQFQGDLAFYTKTGTDLSSAALEERMTIKQGGEVGIGTANPTATLDVVGNIRTRNLAGAGQRNVVADADGNLVIGAGGGGTDGDSDPLNEIQDISLSGTEISITGGSTIDLAPLIPPGGSDDQNLELTGDVLSIEGGSGNVDLSTYINDADFDPMNELQDISLSGTEISITSGSTIDLAPLIPSGGSDDQNLELAGDILSIEGGAGTVDLSTYINDADFDPMNELQDISLSGTEISITSGSTIDLAPLIPPGGSDDQNLELAGDVLSIEGGSGSVDLSTYINDADFDPMNEVDVTAQTGILLGDGTDVTGLIGSAEGQVPKWNTVSGTWVPGTDETGAGGSGAEELNDLSDAITDFNSVFIGNSSGISNTRTDNTGIGNFSLRFNTTGFGNTAIGSASLQRNTTGDDNTAIGRSSLSGNTIGESNTALGAVTLVLNTTGNNNTAVGRSSLNFNTTGSNNTAVGRSSLFSNTQGSENTAVGMNALNANSTGVNNTAVGFNALSSTTTGGGNTAVGFSSLVSNTATSNTAVGSSSLRFNTTGFGNTAIGFGSLERNTSGNDNAAFGRSSLSGNTIGESNTALGAVTLVLNTTGSDNTAVGRSSLNFNTTGSNNTAVGRSSLFANTTGINNTATGFESLIRNTIGFNNTAYGYQSLLDNTTGFFNTALGSFALNNNVSGANNTALGANALSNVTIGNNNIGVGLGAQVPSATSSNQVRIGNTQISRAEIQVAWTVTSDRRWKTDIQNLPYGLNMVNQLRPVDYVRKNNEKQTRETGFVAQEVKTVLEQLGYKAQGILTEDDNGFMSLRYNDFIPVLTKAIQQQQHQIENLENKNKHTLEQLNRLQAQVNILIQQNRAEREQTN